MLCCLKVHDHEVAAMYWPWTTVLCWPLAQSFENKELRTVHYVIHCWTTLYGKRDWTNEQTKELHEWFIMLNWQTGTETRHQAMKSTSSFDCLSKVVAFFSSITENYWSFSSIMSLKIWVILWIRAVVYVVGEASSTRGGEFVVWLVQR